MPLRWRPLAEDDARAIAGWRYAGRGAAYDVAAPGGSGAERLLASDTPYFALEADATLVGYFCLGPEARTAEGRYRDEALDLGLGVRPDLVGRGRGVACLETALDAIEARQPSARVRATIAAWNRPALRLAARAGFRQVGGFGGFRRGPEGAHVVLVLEPGTRRRIRPPERAATRVDPGHASNFKER